MPEPKPEWAGGNTPVPEPQKPTPQDWAEAEPGTSPVTFATGGGGAPAPTDWRSLIDEDSPTPTRIALFVTYADDGSMDDALEDLIDAAEALGFFFEWAAGNEMELRDVIDDSPLQAALLKGAGASEPI
jgi:hypothetical protein